MSEKNNISKTSYKIFLYIKNFYEARRDHKPPESNTNMKIKTIYKMQIQNKNDDKIIIETIENYIINSINNKYKQKCINDRNDNGKIAQRCRKSITKW